MKYKGFNESNRRGACLRKKNKRHTPFPRSYFHQIVPSNQACFLSNSTASGNERDGIGAGHIACHQVTRLMGEITPPFWSS